MKPTRGWNYGHFVGINWRSVQRRLLSCRAGWRFGLLVVGVLRGQRCGTCFPLRRQLPPTARRCEWVPARDATRTSWTWRRRQPIDRIRRRRGCIVCRQGTLPNKFPVVGKNHQDPDSGIDDLRALDKVAVNDSQDAAAAYDPRPLGKGIRSLLHPSE